MDEGKRAVDSPRGPVYNRGASHQTSSATNAEETSENHAGAANQDGPPQLSPTTALPAASSARPLPAFEPHVDRRQTHYAGIPLAFPGPAPPPRWANEGTRVNAAILAWTKSLGRGVLASGTTVADNSHILRNNGLPASNHPVRKPVADNKHIARNEGSRGVDQPTRGPVAHGVVDEQAASRTIGSRTRGSDGRDSALAERTGAPSDGLRQAPQEERKAPKPVTDSEFAKLMADGYLLGERMRRIANVTAKLDGNPNQERRRDKHRVLLQGNGTLNPRSQHSHQRKLRVEREAKKEKEKEKEESVEAPITPTASDSATSAPSGWTPVNKATRTSSGQSSVATNAAALYKKPYGRPLRNENGVLLLSNGKLYPGSQRAYDRLKAEREAEEEEEKSMAAEAPSPE